MLKLRQSAERGYSDEDWLKSYHSFSFADYYDPEFMAWGNLRVINEDSVAAGQGFPKHSHNNMEIISYVLSGALVHRDSMNNTTTILPGEVQSMSAGTGVTHSEFNHDANQLTHFLQIWITPHTQNLMPSYAQKTIPPSAKEGQLCLIASAQGENNAVRIHADAKVYAGLFSGEQTATLSLDPTRKAYVHLITGQLCVNGQTLNAGDALLLSETNQIEISQGDKAEVLVFDLLP
jgi:redox-sensitive bicupin YhaK (pirin superfamily)